MKKWTYLVAALLLTGTTATLTGCLDNDEPAGILQLRGAKAELLKAQASLKLAEAANETAQAAWTQAKADWEQTQVELQKIEIQKQQLTLELQQAQNEYDKVRIQNALNGLNRTEEQAVETHKKTMFDLQKQTVEAENAYNNALKDIEVALLTINPEYKITVPVKGEEGKTEEVYAYPTLRSYYTEMNEAKEKLYGDGVPNSDKTKAAVMTKYKAALNAVAEATLNSTKAYDKVGIENTVAYYQRKLDAQKALAEKNLEIFDGTSIESWIPKLDALEKELAAMKKQYTPLYQRDSLLEREIFAAKLEYTKVFQGTPSGAKGVKSSYILDDNEAGGDIISTYEAKSAEIDKKYATDDLVYKYELPDAIREDVLTEDEIAQGVTAYEVDYAAFTAKNPSGETEFDDYVIPDNLLPQANQNLAVLKVENEKLAADYKAAIAKWADARDKYNTAALNYGWSNEGSGSSLKYVETKAVLDAKAEIASDKLTMKDTTDIADAMGKYLRLRYAFDGYKQTYTETDDQGEVVDKDWADLLTASVKKEDLEKALGSSVFMTKMESILGSNDRDDTSIAETKVGYPLFVETSNKALGEVRYAEYSETEIKEKLDDDKKINTSWGLFSKSYNKNVDYMVLNTSITNRDAWIAFTNDIKAQAKTWEAYTNEEAKEMAEMLAKLVADSQNLVATLEAKTAEQETFSHDVAVIKAEQGAIEDAIGLLKQYITKDNADSNPLIDLKNAAEIEEYVANLKATNAYQLAQYEEYLEKAQNMKKLFDEGWQLTMDGDKEANEKTGVLPVEYEVKISEYNLAIKEAELAEWEKKKAEAEEKLASWTEIYKKAMAIYTGSTQG